MISIQTNVASLVAQENLATNTNFQQKTIQQLTSGYRINASGDDAAGLAVANKYRSDIAQLNQGVLNANDGLSTLQIADGGMNNISLMLDRLNTLATQSASSAFTGDRNTVNSEFQTLITEINRQAQAIGLSANGVLNTNINVFMGGGKVQGTNADSTVNGTVTLNLTSAAVDTKTLGLSGMVAVGGTADIGNGSATHTVSQILADIGNTTSAASTTNLFFSGPGFADASSVKVAVNLSGVTDINSLVVAVNSAIAGTAGGVSQADAAFKAANIVASVHTDSNGGQQLQFSSSISAFQVSAGDVMANALLGNFTSGTTGSALTATVAGATTSSGAVAAPTGVTVQISGGGMASPVSLTLGAGSTTTVLALSDLATQVSNNAALQAAGISMTGTAGTTPMTFTSALGQTLNVAVTGDAANRLGYGSFLAGAANAADYKNVTAGVAYATTASGTANLEFSLNGAATTASKISVPVSGGDATSGAAVGTVAGAVNVLTGDTLAFTADDGVHTVTFGSPVTTVAAAAAAIQTQATAGGWGVTAVVDGSGHLKIASTNTGVGSFVNVTGGVGASELGMLNYTAIAGGGTYSNAAATQTGTVQLEFSLNGAASNPANNLTVNLLGGNAAGGVATGGAAGAIADVNGQSVIFKVDGGNTVTYTFAVATTTMAAAQAALQAASTANGWGVTVALGSNLTITSNSKGPGSDVQITGGSAIATLGLSVQHNYGTARTAADIASALTTAIGLNGALTAAGITATQIGGGFSIAGTTPFSVSESPSVGTGTLGLSTVGGVIAGAVAQTNTGAAMTETSLLTQINAALNSNTVLQAAALQAVDAGGFIKLQSNNNTYFRLGASTSTANIGFGIGDGTQYAGASATTSEQYSIASQGAANAAGTLGTSLLTWSNLVDGNQTQAITLSANNAAGVQQTLTVSLANNAAASRSGQTIDQAISYINQQLQQSNNPTLQQIVAVKEDSTGTQKINFISSLNNFTVTVGAGSAGVNSGTASSIASTTLGTGNNVSVDTIANATQAINAIAAATVKLGSAQAGVGRGENQLSWAINLAQSQISNFSSAQSRIRDADVAAQAANLTKAQVLQQASIAAMAQANSAPQAVLALLRG